MGLSQGEGISIMRSAVLIQYTRVTDRQTDRRTNRIGVAHTRYSIINMLSRVKRRQFFDQTEKFDALILTRWHNLDIPVHLRRSQEI